MYVPATARAHTAIARRRARGARLRDGATISRTDARAMRACGMATSIRKPLPLVRSGVVRCVCGAARLWCERGGVGKRGGHAAAERRGRRGGRRRVRRGRGRRGRRRGGAVTAAAIFLSCKPAAVVFASTSNSTRPARRFDLVTLKGRAAGSCQCGPPVWRSRSNLQCRATERSGHWAGMMGCDKHGSSRREREPFGWLSKNAPGLRHLPQVYLGSRELEEPRGRSALQKRGAITMGRPRYAGRWTPTSTPPRRFQTFGEFHKTASLAGRCGGRQLCGA